MNQNQVRTLIEQMAAAMMRQNDGEVVEFFAEDAVFLAPAGRFIGKKAIYDTGHKFNRDYDNIVIKVKEVIYCGNKGVVEWSFAERRKSDGYTHVMEDAVVFHLNDEGKVTYWREYFDPQQVELI